MITMRSILKYFLAIMFTCYVSAVVAQKQETVWIKTPGITCESCKFHLEKLMLGQAGIVETDVNYYGKRTRVVFLPSRVKKVEILAMISGFGYVADDELPEPEIVKRLPLCCRADAQKSFEAALKAKTQQPVPLQTTTVKTDTIKAVPMQTKKDTVKVTPVTVRPDVPKPVTSTPKSKAKPKKKV
jgi:periplasmic mercuric ion binding protein